MVAAEADDAGTARRGCRVACLLLLLALAACSASEPEPPPPPPAPVRPALPPPDVGLSAGARIDRLCQSLKRIVDTEIRAFADLRGEPIGPRAWQGRVVPPAMSSCRVEGDFYPAAEYVCRGALSARGRPETLKAAFDEQANDLDACLDRPSWGERGWTRGQTFTFAAGERQILWRFGGNVQRPGVSLKIEEDIGRSIWFIRLAVMTLR